MAPYVKESVWRAGGQEAMVVNKAQILQVNGTINEYSEKGIRFKLRSDGCRQRTTKRRRRLHER
jgi:hypothetical protein